MEHSVIELRDAQEMLQAIDLAGAAPIVRLTSNDGDLIKRVMDAGAHGVMVPCVNSAADAEKAVRAVYYPPLGARGVGLARAQGYGAAFPAYKEWLGNEAVVIVMIEHIDAVGAIDEIFSVPGVDGYMIGPYDLSASLGVAGDFGHPNVVAAVGRIRDAGMASNMPGGIHIVDPDLDQLKLRIEEGFTFIGYGMDIRILDTFCREHLAAIRDLA